MTRDVLAPLDGSVYVDPHVLLGREPTPEEWEQIGAALAHLGRAWAEVVDGGRRVTEEWRVALASRLFDVPAALLRDRDHARRCSELHRAYHRRRR